MTNLVNSLREAVGRFSEGFKELLKPDTSSAIYSIAETEEKEPAHEIEQNSLASSFDQWLKKKNAEHFRNSCHVYTSFIFQQPGDFELAFGKALAEFWHIHGAFTSRKAFPEIHVIFLTVNVSRLRDTWNRRDVDLKQALLMELRRGFVVFARSRGFSFDGWFDYVVTDVWKVKDMLVIELPCSAFPFTYPQLVPVLAPEEYWRLKASLNTRSEL